MNSLAAPIWLVSHYSRTNIAHLFVPASGLLSSCMTPLCNKSDHYAERVLVPGGKKRCRTCERIRAAGLRG